MKNPQPPFKVVLTPGEKNGINGIFVGRDFCDSKMDAIVWIAYTDEHFWDQLWNNRSNLSALQKILAGKGFTGRLVLNAQDLQRLQQSLNRKTVQMDPDTLMKHLHQYTVPARNIDAHWGEW